MALIFAQINAGESKPQNMTPHFNSSFEAHLDISAADLKRGFQPSTTKAEERGIQGNPDPLGDIRAEVDGAIAWTVV